MTEYRNPISHDDQETHELYKDSQKTSSSSKLNWLRAAVLGANDGIVSISAMILGVAGAYSSTGVILTAGIAGTVAGALSMAVGEYVSVSSQRDAERALLAKEKQELIDFPEEELKELAYIYERKGLSHETAQKVAEELTAKDAFAAHVDAELNIDPDDLTNPWHAAYASAIAFTCGALIPLLASVIVRGQFQIPGIFGAVVVALLITGTVSAHIGGAGKQRAAFRVVIGGILAMVITYAIGRLFKVSGI